MNPAAASLTGWKLKETLGKLLSGVFNNLNPETMEPAVDPVKRALETGKIVGLNNDSIYIVKQEFSCVSIL